MQRKMESTFLIRHQLFGFAMATVIITIKAQIYFDIFFSPCALITQGLVCVFGGALCIKEVSVFAQCTPDWWLYCSSQSDLCGLTEKWKSWVFFHYLFFFFFFATREITHPHSSTFLKVLLWEGEKSIKTKRKGEINDKNRRYNALFAIMATILCISIFNLRSYTIEMGSIVRQRLVLFTCRHLQLENVTPRA